MDSVFSVLASVTHSALDLALRVQDNWAITNASRLTVPALQATIPSTTDGSPETQSAQPCPRR